MYFLFFPITIMPDADTSTSAKSHPIGVSSPVFGDVVLFSVSVGVAFAVLPVAPSSLPVLGILTVMVTVAVSCTLCPACVSVVVPVPEVRVTPVTIFLSVYAIAYVENLSVLNVNSPVVLSNVPSKMIQFCQLHLSLQIKIKLETLKMF